MRPTLKLSELELKTLNRNIHPLYRTKSRVLTELSYSILLEYYSFRIHNHKDLSFSLKLLTFYSFFPKTLYEISIFNLIVKFNDPYVLLENYSYSSSLKSFNYYTMHGKEKINDMEKIEESIATSSIDSLAYAVSSGKRFIKGEKELLSSPFIRDNYLTLLKSFKTKHNDDRHRV
jgi:hypothetical protein